MPQPSAPVEPGPSSPQAAAAPSAARQLFRDLAPFTPLALAALDLLSSFSVDHGFHPETTILLLGSGLLALLVRKAWGARQQSTLLQDQVRCLRQETQITRDHEVAQILHALRTCDSLAIIGRPGSGKSRVAAVELPSRLARSAEFLPLPLVNAYPPFGDWNLSLLTACRRAGLLAPDESSANPLDVLDRVPDDTQVVLLFDDFEVYLRHIAQYLRGSDGTIAIQGLDLSADAEFWDGLRARIVARRLKLVFFCDAELDYLLRPLTIGATKTYHFQRIPRTVLERKISNALRDSAWHPVLRTLVDELCQDGHVLPAEFAQSVSALDVLGIRTIGEYRSMGGALGLQARALWQNMLSIARDLAVPPHSVIATFSLTFHRELTCDTANEADFRKRCELSVDQVRAVLQRLEGESLVRANAYEGLTAWRVSHVHFSAAFERMQADYVRLDGGLRERYAAYAQATTMLASWRGLLAPSHQVRQLLLRLQGRIRYGTYRRYALLSTLRLVPYALLVGLLADSGAVFPGSEWLRDGADALSASVFRRPPDAQTLSIWREDRARDWDDTVRRSIETAYRRNEYLHETWARGQNAYAAACSEMDPALSSNLHNELKDLYSDLYLPRPGGIPYTWKRSNNTPDYFVLPFLWIGSASYRHARFFVGAEPDRVALFSEYRLILESIEPRFYSAIAGHWTFYPDQVTTGTGKDPGSTYAAMLALTYLIEKRATLESFGLSTQSTISQIESTAKWLWSARAGSGWQRRKRDGAGDLSVLGLSLQGYATLLRLYDAGWLPETISYREVVEAAVAVLLSVEVDEAFSYHLEMDESSGAYRLPATDFRCATGECTVEAELLVSYVKPPWAIELAFRLLESDDAEAHVAAHEQVQIRRLAAALLDKERVDAWVPLVGWWTQPELFIALSGCR